MGKGHAAGEQVTDGSNAQAIELAKAIANTLPNLIEGEAGGVVGLDVPLSERRVGTQPPPTTIQLPGGFVSAAAAICFSPAASVRVRSQCSSSSQVKPASVA